MSIADDIADEMAIIQAEAGEYLSQSCTIQREVKSVDGAGHDKPASWSTLNGGAVCCGLSKNQSRIAALVGGELSSLNLWLLQVPWKTIVAIGDQVLFGSSILHVESVGDQQSNPLVLEVVVSEFEGAPEDQS
jgi:hypothetical protein